MARISNNVDLDKIAQTVEIGKKDRSNLRKPVKLQGEWVLDSNLGYQFRTELSYEKGKQVIEIDSPSYMGGNGNRLGPMGYCVAGIASCFASTFASAAAMQNVRLTRFTIDAECIVNFAKTFDVANKPIVEGLVFHLGVESDNADRKRLLKLVRMAEERCPAVYSMTHKISVKAELT